MALISVTGIIKTNELLPVSMLEVDMDVDADRFVVIDRDTLETMYASSYTSSLKLVLPIDYANKDGLLVMILDDDGQYNATALDGVRASIANLSEI